MPKTSKSPYQHDDQYHADDDQQSEYSNEECDGYFADEFNDSASVPSGEAECEEGDGYFGDDFGHH